MVLHRASCTYNSALYPLTPAQSTVHPRRSMPHGRPSGPPSYETVIKPQSCGRGQICGRSSSVSVMGLMMVHCNTVTALRAPPPSSSSSVSPSRRVIVLRTEFKPYTDIKPVKLIRAKSQYHPPDEKTSLETSYSATFRGEQAKLQPADNKALERRRIRSLYSEPYLDPSKVRVCEAPSP
ncbi:hypothetical protein NFI96_012796 [Prochilodus magdalenae]|nr:hypothetical protein NFI96_012796 [Prochilodus magdalenae]